MCGHFILIKRPTHIDMNALDIETLNDHNDKFIPICICYFFDNINYYEYYNIDENIILKSIKNMFKVAKKQNSVVYVHNINFDGFLIIEYLSKQKEVVFDFLIRENNIYSINLYFNTKSIKIKCSYKLIPNSLDKISRVFNIGSKMIFPHKFSKLDNLNYIGEVPSCEYFNSYDEYLAFSKENLIFNFKEYIIKYCKNDVFITSSFVLLLQEIVSKYGLNIDNIYSAPSLSIKIFIKKYNKNIIKFSLKSHQKEVLKNSYFGGRCEVYGNPYLDEIIHHFDFSGMYAQCMMEKFPFGDMLIEDKPVNVNKPGFYYISYSSNIAIPVLPHRSKISNKLMFSNGENKGIFWFEEIILFLKMGGVIKDIEIGILYEKYDYIFREFVNEFTEIRKKNEVMNIFGKLIINSLYGRMGMNDIDEDSIIFHKDKCEEVYRENNVISIKEINDYIIATVKTKKKKVKSNITIASCITSKARIKLYKAQQDVILNGGRLLYSDTDSIYASYKKDVSNEKHGEVDWSLDKKKIKDAVFINPKTYGIKYLDGSENIKMKGFDNKFIKFEELKKKFYDEYSYVETPSNLFLSKKNIEMFKLESTKKLFLNTYDKRKFIKNKKETLPLALDNYIFYK